MGRDDGQRKSCGTTTKRTDEEEKKREKGRKGGGQERINGKFFSSAMRLEIKHRQLSWLVGGPADYPRSPFDLLCRSQYQGDAVDEIPMSQQQAASR